MVRKVLLIAALVILMLLPMSCQTVQGFGRDVTWTGEKSAQILEGDY